MQSKELPESWHSCGEAFSRSGQGCKTISEAISFPRNTVAPIIVMWKKFETTRTVLELSLDSCHRMVYCWYYDPQVEFACFPVSSQCPANRPGEPRKRRQLLLWLALGLLASSQLLQWLATSLCPSHLAAVGFWTAWLSPWSKPPAFTFSWGFT